MFVFFEIKHLFTTKHIPAI